MPLRRGQLAGDDGQAGAGAILQDLQDIDELDEVIERDFPEVRSRVMEIVAPLAGQWTRWPTPEEIAAALPFTTDPEDAPIFAAARIARPDIVRSDDFRAFHSHLAKTFWEQHHIRVESLYGLLSLFGRRKRRPKK